jgi:hypothetical protein
MLAEALVYARLHLVAPVPPVLTVPTIPEQTSLPQPAPQG